MWAPQSAGLARYIYQHLEELTIVCGYIEPAAWKELREAAEWKLLRCLKISCHYACQLTNVMQLVYVHGANLCELNVSFCGLDLNAVSELVKGCWPLLRSVVLLESAGHSMAPAMVKTSTLSTAGVKCLLSGVWPLLSCLAVSPSDRKAAAYLLSGITELIRD